LENRHLNGFLEFSCEGDDEMEDLSTAVLLGQILDDALLRGASDVHLHAGKYRFSAEFRVSGVLQKYISLEQNVDSVIRRIKALAHMDVTETRIPQDGSFHWESEVNECDVRVASLPTVTGEAVVLRLLIKAKGPLSFTDLGMTEAQARLVLNMLKDSTGLILVSGSTGAGKTTTLYAMMTQLARYGRHVVSIEDPVEMMISECRQMEVRERIGVTFDAGLRSLLRQDPDAIMIGEIRDEQTARVAVRAAMTGRLVLSTTHARDVVGAAARLVEFGLSRSLVGDVLTAVINQKLQPLACVDCNGEECKSCHGTGYLATRAAKFDVYPMSATLSGLIASDLSWGEVRSRATLAAIPGPGIPGIKRTRDAG
jgi:general secretion pathway protein E